MRIGHASINENGSTKNGLAGDQTGKEVCIREWYSKPWDFVLRCIDPIKAETMAKTCEDGCANNNIGYDQNQRNTLRTQAIKCGYDLSKVNTKCECDCSSFMTVCAECAGISIKYNGNNAPTTSTMKKAFTDTGWFKVYTDNVYLKGTSYLKRGDILVKAGSHTVMVLDNGQFIDIQPTNKGQLGIDVSQNQKTIDWAKVKASGIQFAVLRSTKKGNVPDPTFNTNLNGCIVNKVDYSCYKFSYALTVNEAKEEARQVIKLLNGRKMMIWYDVELAEQRSKCTRSQIEAIIFAFITECSLKGYDCGIYCNYDWYKNVLTDNIKKTYPLWIAKYPKDDKGIIVESNKPDCRYMVWQYSSKGNVPGIVGNVDLNFMPYK